MKQIFISLICIMFAFSALAQTNQTLDTVQTTNQDQPKFTPQETTTTQVAPKKTKSSSSFKMKKIFFGGSIGFTFGDIASFRANPLIGYSLTPKLSAGISGLYEYNSYKVAGDRIEFNNYGASVFSRYRVIPSLYAHAEFSYISYEYYDNSRKGIPYLFVGGGYTQRIGGNTYAYAQILFDVLQDKNSPYSDWEPFYSVGVSVGF